MSRTGFVIAAALWALLAHRAHSSETEASFRRIDTLVVCPQVFQSEMIPWIRHRESQGHGIVMVQPEKSALELKARIRTLCKKYPLGNLLLIGDCFAKRINEFHQPPVVPRGTVRAVVNVRFGSEPIICTDNVFADLNDDLVPELTVGRLSVDTALELRQVIQKILDYEKNPPVGPWRQRINLVAGVGGFGSVTDRIIEAAARQLILKGIPADFETRMTYASWRSPYCPDPRNFHGETLKSLNEGSLFWVYFGHGHIHRLDHVKTPVSSFKILNIFDKHKLAARNGPPIAVLLACYTGAMDAIDDCLAEEMLEAPGGPVAVLAGSRITMPYAMAVLSHEMLTATFEGNCETLGELIRKAKQNLAARKKNQFDRTRSAIEAVAGVFSPNRDQLDEERLEHVQLFNIRGDPLLRLPRAKTVPLSTPSTAVSGKSLLVSGDSPHAGRLLVELSFDRAKLPFRPKDRKEFEWTHEFLERIQQEYVSANRKTVARQVFEVDEGPFEVEIDVPEQLKGKFQLRAFIENRQAYAVGSSDIRIR
ncbi:MAG: C25 family cysteine peptidase [Planctomycetota bacterium]|nr:C25 family cysteine peptidase [Planctomycetota bacterium]